MLVPLHSYDQLLTAADSIRVDLSKRLPAGPASSRAPPRVGLFAAPGPEYLAATWAIWQARLAHCSSYLLGSRGRPESGSCGLHVPRLSLSSPQAGGIVVPLATSHPLPELDYVCQDAGVSAVSCQTRDPCRPSTTRARLKCGVTHMLRHTSSPASVEMSDLRRSERKRTQTQFEAATETVANSSGRTKAVQGIASRARAAAVASAYEPLGGLVQLGGGEGRIWVGAEDSPALGGFAPPPADRQRFLELVQQYRDANPVRGGASGLPRAPRFAATSPRRHHQR